MKLLFKRRMCYNVNIKELVRCAIIVKEFELLVVKKVFKMGLCLVQSANPFSYITSLLQWV